MMFTERERSFNKSHCIPVIWIRRSMLAVPCDVRRGRTRISTMPPVSACASAWRATANSASCVIRSAGSKRYVLQSTLAVKHELTVSCNDWVLYLSVLVCTVLVCTYLYKYCIISLTAAYSECRTRAPLLRRPTPPQKSATNCASWADRLLIPVCVHCPANFSMTVWVVLQGKLCYWSLYWQWTWPLCDYVTNTLSTWTLLYS